MEFNKKNGYGNFIEIVPPGEKAMYNSSIAILLGVLWDDMSVNFAVMLCRRDYKKFIPEVYRGQIGIIKKPPTDDGGPFTKSGTVGWNYSPIRKKTKLIKHGHRPSQKGAAQ